MRLMTNRAIATFPSLERTLLGVSSRDATKRTTSLQGSLVMNIPAHFISAQPVSTGVSE
jgi:hypothetical protein